MILKKLANYVAANPPLSHTRFSRGHRCSVGCEACQHKKHQKEAAEALAKIRILLEEIRDAVVVFPSGYREPIEEPDPDGPWLPVGLICKVHEALEGSRK